MPRTPADALKVVPLTPDYWAALADLLGESGPASRCWCMYWRIGAEYRKQMPEANKSAFHAVVLEGPPPGLIALEGERAVGWCQVTSRDVLPHLEQFRQLRRIDDVAVWSISCFFVRKGYRRKGVSAALIAGAIRAAKKAGAPALEAYPLDPELSPSATSTGYVSTFLRAGFRIVARHAAPRPIVRIDFRTPKKHAR